MKKYNFQELEKKWQEYWEKEGIYKFDPKSKKPIYSIDMPPPYVSAAHLHVGHVFSYTQAEFVVRFWRMRGKNIYYPMGFDDNGLPTERYVEKKYKVDKSKITRKEFIKLCLKETKLGAKTYEKLWRDLGISVDWIQVYSTINPLCQRISQRSFIDLAKKGLLERREEPVVWCPFCQTALAQADLDDQELESQFIYMKFKTKSGQEVPIATTRPELMPACVAVFVNPDDKRYQNLIDEEVEIPFFNRTVKVYANKSVDPEFGSGVAYHCTFGDADDIRWVKEYKLPIIQIINKDGTLNDQAGPYQGLTIKEARQKVVEDLDKAGLIEKKEPLTHVVNVHDRCGTEIEFIMKKQWFIKILENKEIFLKQGEKLKWFPKYMKVRYDDWVKGLQWDWNISRERYYGVPFPVWYCQCGEVIIADAKDLPVDPMSDQPKKPCPKCHKKDFKPELNVMDTWMTSSLTPLINARWQESDSLLKKIYPMSLRPQAFEIIRTWLFYTMVKSYYHTDSLPWQDVMISGHGLAESGKKMSKSEGNFITGEEVLGKYPADALRYWAAGANLGSNLKYQEAEVKNGKRLVVKLWNAAKFAIQNLDDYKGQEVDLLPIDQWILAKLQLVIEQTTKHFEEYEYAKAKDGVEKFFWRDFCDYYLEIVKYRFYDKDVDEQAKHSAQFALYHCLLNVIKLFAPVIPYVTEDIYQQYFKEFAKKKSLHICTWPEVDDKYRNNQAIDQGEMVVEIVNAVRKAKSDQGLSVGKEAKKITLSTNKEIRKILELFLKDIQKVNRAKNVEFVDKVDGDKILGGKVTIKVELLL